MSGPRHQRTRKPMLAASRAFLRLYPGEFRDDYGREMAMLLSDRYRDAASTWERVVISMEALTDIVFHAPKEHSRMILRDLRYALRVLPKTPAFTITAILSLAIGIGANTAIVAAAKKVLVDTLPVKNPRQLRMLTWVSGGEQPVPPVWGDVYSTKEGGLASTSFFYPVLQELRKKTDVFQDLIVFKDVEMTATVDGHPELISGEMLSGNAFSVLGVKAIAGRTLTPADDSASGAEPAAVISEGYWTERFSRSPSRTDHMLLFKLNPPRTRSTDGNMEALYKQLEEKLTTIPGVRSVSLSNISLVGDGHSGSSFHVSGRPLRKQEDRVQTNSVGADFFRTMGIHLLHGRSFNVHDNARSPNVSIVNQALVRQYFPSGNPIGETFECEDAGGPVKIVGVVADTKYGDLRSETPPTFYVPYQQRSRSSRMIFEIRTATEPFGVLRQVRSTVESLDPELPLLKVRTQEQQIETSLSTERMFAQLTSTFGLLALVLAAIGIYGLMAYTVVQRTGEIGIRMALGAGVKQVLAGVLYEALWMALIGLSAGICVALWLGRFVGTMLYGLKATDPITLAATALLLVCITLLAGLEPARRASRVDPLVALRHT